MYIRLTENTSGAVLYDGPQEHPDASIEAATDIVLFQLYAGELERDEPNGHIPNGCGAYRTETRRTSNYEPWVCWESLDWFPKEEHA